MGQNTIQGQNNKGTSANAGWVGEIDNQGVIWGQMCAHLGDESTGRAAPGHASAAAFNRLPPGPHVRPVST